MFVQRIEYQCNYAYDSLLIDDTKSGLPDTLVDAMKDYSIVKENMEVFTSKVVAIIERVDEKNKLVYFNRNEK